jgi:hypothetical protein
MNLAIAIQASSSIQSNIRKAFVVCVPGRGSPRAKSTPLGMQWSSLTAKQRAGLPNVLAYAAPDPVSGLPLGGGQILAISSTTERPIPAYLVLHLVDETNWRLAIDPSTLVAQTPVQVSPDLDAVLQGPDAYLEELWKRLDCKQSPAKCFFADLDRRTNPELIDACHRKFPSVLPTADLLATRLAVSSLMTALNEQLVVRTRESGGIPLESYLHRHLHNHARFISRVFLDLAATYFSCGKGIDLAAFEKAFESFALGELSVRLPNGFTTTQPSSGYFVFFSELALFCRTAGIDTATWEPLLNVLVRSQAAFFRVHTRSDGAPQRGVGDYGPHTYDSAAAQLYRSSGNLEALRATYVAYVPQDLATRSSALASEFLPHLVNPPPPD